MFVRSALRGKQERRERHCARGVSGKTSEVTGRETMPTRPKARRPSQWRQAWLAGGLPRSGALVPVREVDELMRYLIRRFGCIDKIPQTCKKLSNDSDKWNFTQRYRIPINSYLYVTCQMNCFHEIIDIYMEKWKNKWIFNKRLMKICKISNDFFNYFVLRFVKSCSLIIVLYSLLI